MKKTKIEQRMENAVNAFFETENRAGETALVYGNQTAILQNEANEEFAEKSDKRFDFFKKAVLFLPGTFVLFFATLASVFFYKDLGVNFWTLFWLASGGFMVWAGLGDLKNKKHLLLPLSVVSVALTLAIGFGFLPESVQPQMFFEHSIYFFPIALIVPFLVKSRINGQEVEK